MKKKKYLKKMKKLQDKITALKKQYADDKWAVEVGDTVKIGSTSYKIYQRRVIEQYDGFPAYICSGRSEYTHNRSKVYNIRKEDLR